MTDEAREILVAAALRGHPQSKGQFHYPNGGDCALGILHLTLHTSRERAIACTGSKWEEIEQKFGLSYYDTIEIYERNDRGEDFLTIARKACRPVEAP